MRFLETPVFTRAIDSLLDSEDFRKLQMALVFRPEQGAIIRGSGGLRKIRWTRPGAGKRGGCRVIYFFDVARNAIYLLFAYAKNERDDLTVGQMKTLRRVVKEEFK